MIHSLLKHMSLRIHNDQSRFKDIIRGKIKQNLREYIKRGELISKQGDEKISVPVPSVELPHFRFEEKSKGGVGQGAGKVGDAVNDKDGEKGENSSGSASSVPGEHSIEVEVSLTELADLLGEELHLPMIEKKGKKNITAKNVRYTGVHTIGPQALKHFARTYKNALKRQISHGSYNKDNPIVVPMRDDFRYRSYTEVERPESNAVIIYMMDVSGSMGDEQKELVRIESFWIDTWLRRHYDGIDTRYIIHDAAAKEVDRDTFFHTRESGGTMISSAYRLCAEIIDDHYPADDWNIYAFHFSDGDNWSIDDTRFCINILREKILSKVNQFCYGQVESPYGSGQFLKDLQEHFKQSGKVALSEIKDRDSIYQSIKDFLSRGK